MKRKIKHCVIHYLIQDRKVGNSQLLNRMQTFPVLLPSNEKSRERKITKRKRYGITSILKTQNFILFSFVITKTAVILFITHANLT